MLIVNLRKLLEFPEIRISPTDIARAEATAAFQRACNTLNLSVTVEDENDILTVVSTWIKHCLTQELNFFFPSLKTR